MLPSRRLNKTARTYFAIVAAAVAALVGFRIPRCDSLSNMSITVPVAVASGESAKMTCTYDLESDPLYTVKWYKGRQEFFRYVPKELPHTRVFPWPGINVDVSQSGPNQVVLRDVRRHLSGKYRCEVSADAPSFHTKIVSSWMHVVYPPVGQPVLSLEKRHYTIGDTLKGNCTSPPSSPPSNVTWYLNDKWMNSSYGRSSSGRATLDDASRSTNTVGLELEVNSFKVGKMRIRCVAELYGVFKTSSETVLDEEKPRLASILGTFSSTGASHTSSFSLLIVILVSVWIR
ncbi:uncharacterized protein LOC114125235 [Aphis gossypii]|uniref:Ig-like domain-containing protein n=1 Tax=Aphis gossypii TaxID=80765 RepID=A0A9P0NDC4_APHGO|nr:uncharacterized protein LOC114125235 [Aphis gossypii]CAH1713772.1 unnamed protein product [Aphis gossypii]